MHNFREALIFKLCRTFNNDEVQTILDQVESVLVDYELRPKETHLSVSNGDEIIKDYFKAKLIEGTSKTSIKVYASEIRNFCQNIDNSILYVSTQEIRDYFFKLKEQHEVSDCSLEHRRLVINNLYEWMVDNKYIQENPCKGISHIKYRTVERQPLTPKELEKVRYACRNKARDAALIEFMFSTGCRVAEISRIKLTDVDFYTKEVNVVGKGNKERTVYLNDAAIESIRRYLETRKHKSEYLFTGERNTGGNPLSTDAIRDSLRDIGKRAGLSRPLRPHDMRHTTATYAIRRGMPIEDVQSYLGHSRLDTTMIYVKLDKSRVKQNHQKCFA